MVRRPLLVLLLSAALGAAGCDEGLPGDGIGDGGSIPVTAEDGGADGGAGADATGGGGDSGAGDGGGGDSGAGDGGAEDAGPLEADGGPAGGDAGPDAGSNPGDAEVDGGPNAGDAEVDGGPNAGDAEVDGGPNAGDAEVDGGLAPVGDGGLDAGAPSDGGSGSDAGQADGAAPADASDDGGEADGGASVDGGSSADGGSSDGGALGLPLSDFCGGSGAVVQVGASGECAGQVAQRTFRFGVCTCGNLSAQSNLLVDAFDSARGAYNASTPAGPNVLQDGHVGVDGALAMSGRLTTLGSVFVSGGGFSVGAQSSVSVNVYAAGAAVQSNGVSSIGRNAFIDGDVLGRYTISNSLYVPLSATVDSRTASAVGGAIVRGPIPSVEPCPCAPGDLLDVAALVAFGAANNDNAATGAVVANAWENGNGPDTLILPCGRYFITSIQHTRSLTIRATGRTVLYVAGDLAVTGSLRLEVDPGAEIDVFIAGSLVPGASLRFGSASRPSAVRTYVGGTGAVGFGSSSIFGGNLYAPRADVTFAASASLFGALFANNAGFGGSAEVHFDTAIRSAGDECNPPDGGVSDGGVADGGAGLDAGVADGGAPDAGGCTECWECGQLACLIPPAASAGSCGPCASDLDCCPTHVCWQGVCISPF